MAENADARRKSKKNRDKIFRIIVFVFSILSGIAGLFIGESKTFIKATSIALWVYAFINGVFIFIYYLKECNDFKELKSKVMSNIVLFILAVILGIISVILSLSF